MSGRGSEPTRRSNDQPTTGDPAAPPLPREAPEQKEPNRLLTDTGESSECPAHPTAARSARQLVPEESRAETPSRHRPRDCPSAHATIERHTRRAARRVRSSPPGSRAENQHTEGQPRTPDSQRRQLRHLKPQQRPYTILRNTGKSPQYSLRDPLPRTATAERATLGFWPPAEYSGAALVTGGWSKSSQTVPHLRTPSPGPTRHN
ncbi:Serine/threonine protein kinase [Giardia duodenalis]|uniref:Serine/threonine protein kinase n=1 Tax=Giardia intestinalis TaxID=5741 RepID=V6TKA8_GIAIN|nr:Serine/threonine protein kinase [Giardia intestinalis]